MAPHTHFIVVLTIFFSVYVLFLSPAMVAASPTLVAKVCDAKTLQNHDFCFKVLSDPHAATAKNLNQLTDAVMKSAAKAAQTTLNVIERLTKNPTSPAALKALKTCEEVFRYAVRSFGMISAELKEDAMSANYDVSVVGPEADRCLSALQAAKVNAPEIAKGSRNLVDYSAIGSEITSKM